MSTRCINMTKYLITTNCGYGDNHQVGDVANQEEADQLAYEIWKEEAETQAIYYAQELTPELAEEHDVEDELY